MTRTCRHTSLELDLHCHVALHFPRATVLHHNEIILNDMAHVTSHYVFNAQN